MAHKARPHQSFLSATLCALRRASARHVKVSDFNLSRVMEPHGTISTLSTANPRWMAPEVIRGEAPTLAADVFAFGEQKIPTVVAGYIPWPHALPLMCAWCTRAWEIHDAAEHLV